VLANVQVSIAFLHIVGIFGDESGTAVFFLPRYLRPLRDIPLGELMRDPCPLPLALCAPKVDLVLIHTHWFIRGYLRNWRLWLPSSAFLSRGTQRVRGYERSLVGYVVQVVN
jgi:hypothetical protein